MELSISICNACSSSHNTIFHIIIYNNFCYFFTLQTLKMKDPD